MNVLNLVMQYEDVIITMLSMQLNGFQEQFPQNFGMIWNLIQV